MLKASRMRFVTLASFASVVTLVTLDALVSFVSFVSFVSLVSVVSPGYLVITRGDFRGGHSLFLGV